MPLNIRAEQIDPTQEKVLVELTRDVLALRASFLLLTAKLDLDATVTDTNYAALTNPVASNVAL